MIVAVAVVVVPVGRARGHMAGTARGVPASGAVGSPRTRATAPDTEEGHEEEGEREEEQPAVMSLNRESDSQLHQQVPSSVPDRVADVSPARAHGMHISASRVEGLPVAVLAKVEQHPSAKEGRASEIPMVGSHVRGAHLHQTHRAADNLPVSMPGGPPRALVKDHATDSDRVGGRQPPPRGGIGGPCKLHCSSGRSETEAAATARHPAVGAAAPRPDAWSSASNPRAGGLAADSKARSHSVRVPEKARRHGAPPSKGTRAGVGSHAGRQTQESITVATLVVTPLTIPVNFSAAATTIVDEGVGVGEVGGVVGDVVAHVLVGA
jgi:hypothetical protein